MGVKWGLAEIVNLLLYQGRACWHDPLIMTVHRGTLKDGLVRPDETFLPWFQVIFEFLTLFPLWSKHNSVGTTKKESAGAMLASAPLWKYIFCQAECGRRDSHRLPTWFLPWHCQALTTSRTGTIHHCGQQSKKTDFLPFLVGHPCCCSGPKSMITRTPRIMNTHGLWYRSVSDPLCRSTAVFGKMLVKWLAW